MLHKIIALCCLGILLNFAGCINAPINTDQAGFQNKYGHYDYCKMSATMQSRSNSCGTACLASVLNYWGIQLTEQQLNDENRPANEKGYTLKELKAIAKRNGLNSYVLSMIKDPDQQLKEQITKGRPVICTTRFPQGWYFAYKVPIYGNIYRWLIKSIGPEKDHYIVVFGFDEDDFLIMDPNVGLVSFDQKYFHSCWSQMQYGVLLCANTEDGLASP